MTANQPDDQPTPEVWGLVIPFVACKSHGGPYDDDSFVAGYQAGEVGRTLALHAVSNGTRATFTVRTDLLRQVELAAMSHGFPIMEHTDHDGGWSTVTFSREQV